MDVVSGEANRNDNRDGEAFVFDAVEKRTPISDNIAVNKELAGRGNEEVGGSTPLVSSKELSPNLAI